jgi:hypothetical protein
VGAWNVPFVTGKERITGVRVMRLGSGSDSSCALRRSVAIDGKSSDKHIVS